MKCYGIPRGSKIDTFIVARRDWSVEWERLAVRALVGALSGFTLSLLRWRFDVRGLLPGWGCVVEATGAEAEEALSAAIEGDAASSAADSWDDAHFKWSSRDSLTSAVAFKKLGEYEDIGRYWPPGDWTESRGDQLQTIGVYVWGQRREEVLGAIAEATRLAEDGFGN